MRCTIVCLCFFVLLAARGLAQSPDPPIADQRLTVHTLLREDIFAGFRADNMERLKRGEKNIDLLMKQRPEEKADLLAWKGGATLYRAVLAHEANQSEEFERLYKESVDSMCEALTISPKDPGVAAVVGGSYALFADRLPEEHHAAAWSECYDSYQVLWSLQGPKVAKLPVHLSGELLAGLAQSSQRTGRADELQQYLAKMIEVLPKTSYSRMAQRWMDDPSSAVGSNITCKSCHSKGRLAVHISNLKGK